MTRLEKEIQKFIKPYNVSGQQKWKVTLPDGHGGQIRRSGFVVKSFAVQFASETYQKVLLNKGKNPLVNRKVTFSAYAEDWLQEKSRQGLSEGSIMKYKDEIRLRLVPYFGKFHLNDLTKDLLRKYVVYLQELNASTSVVSTSGLILKMILKKAIEYDLINSENILSFKFPGHKPKEPRYWDQTEATFFLNSTIESEYFNLWKLVLFTGMRAGEIAGLKWDCVHLDRKFGSFVGYIEIRRSWNSKTKRIQETTKTGDRRVIPILPQIRDLLIKLKIESNGSLVLGGESPMNTSHFSRKLLSDLEMVPEVKKINFHGLRHTFCSWLDSTGMSRRVVSQMALQQNRGN